MGIDINAAKLLLWSRKHGVDFSSTVTLGRQNVFLPWNQLARAVRRLAMSDALSLPALEAAAQNKYAESFFACLGATDVQSIDASAYEHASIIHDMNLPITARGRQFSCLYDGGTLEHVFNLRASFENCMKLVAKGGHVLHVLPANNFFGHGFYQFSAEFFYRLYSVENGFEVRKILLVEDCPGGRWMEVPDPSILRRRAIFSNVLPTNVYVVARKIADIDEISKFPQQSDYEQLSWVGGSSTASNHTALRNFVRNSLPKKIGRTALILKHFLAKNPDIKPFDINQ